MKTSEGKVVKYLLVMNQKDEYFQGIERGGTWGIITTGDPIKAYWFKDMDEANAGKLFFDEKNVKTNIYEIVVNYKISAAADVGTH